MTLVFVTKRNTCEISILKSIRLIRTISQYRDRYFMEESIMKAISLDSFEPGQKNSNVVDDVFFIIRKSIR